MAGPQTITTGAVFIPEVWSAEALIALRANLVMEQLVSRPPSEMEATIQQMGDVLHFPNVSNLTANDKAAGSDVTFQNPTETEVTITINKHKEISFQIERILDVQAMANLRAIYTGQAGFGLAKAMDSDLLGLHASWTNAAVGAAGQEVTEDAILDAIALLDLAEVPQTDRFAVFHVSQRKPLLKIDKFVRADAVGNGDAIRTGLIGEIYGVRIFLTTQVPLSGGERKNQMFHRSGIGLARQQGVNVNALYQPKSIATDCVSDMLYGVGLFRTTAGVVIKT